MLMKSRMRRHAPEQSMKFTDDLCQRWYEIAKGEGAPLVPVQRNGRVQERAPVNVACGD